MHYMMLYDDPATRKPQGLEFDTDQMLYADILYQAMYDKYENCFIFDMTGNGVDKPTDIAMKEIVKLIEAGKL